MESTIAPLSALMLDQPSYLDALSGLVHSPECLAAKSFVTARLSDADLEKKRRCARCNILLVKKERRSRQKVLPKKDPALSTTPGSLQSKMVDEIVSLGMEQLKLEETRAPEKRCKFHDGKVVNKKWTCCDQHVMGPPCKKEDEHKPEKRTLKEISSRWQYSVTPSITTKDTRKAVVIDCEMGTAASGDTELIRLTLIDYFSSNVLIDKIVWPDVPMLHLNTKWSGVTWKMMNEARNKRKCVFGWKKARALIWKFVGPETIVIGHGVKSDLTSLRWIHPRLIDTLIVEGNNRETAAGLSLKKLAEERLGRAIQQGRGHDSLEDAIATRDLLHWNVLKLTGGLTEV
ncbi:RNA exonuclease 3 [Fusarium subglutinans]|uniref:RNA exonuclease 3 n=1 Tax=Gibberella subglutinans TaxID=42677 RepID=A0A8H5P7T3_GIBSU|nr:RNA exonuclease 3 [Fusarium subglutinans]KAF5591599.1 RNA exonuclease 3 [Fusarium subglutinans]